MTTNSFEDARCRSIAESLKQIRENISEAAVRSGRNAGDIRLMAVTKTVEPEYINYSIDRCGVDLIGENKVQEFLGKKDLLHLSGVEKHIIGHLQTNKVKKILPFTDLIQSVDSVHLAAEISKEASLLGKTAEILFEINVGGEESKTGFDRAVFTESLDELSALPNIRVRGLMTIPPATEDHAALCRYFSEMAGLYHDLAGKGYPNFDFSILSMGMSGDYITAIENGANLVRIGTLIYGARNYNKS